MEGTRIIGLILILLALATLVIGLVYVGGANWDGTDPDTGEQLYTYECVYDVYGNALLNAKLNNVRCSENKPNRCGGWFAFENFGIFSAEGYVEMHTSVGKKSKTFDVGLYSTKEYVQRWECIPQQAFIDLKLFDKNGEQDDEARITDYEI